jgi:hypothetical protein
MARCFFVWIGLGFLIGCGDATEPLGRQRDGSAQDRDARVLRDASSPDDALIDAAAAVPMRSWMDVPAGPASTPREVCARTWQVPSRAGATDYNTVPIASFRDVIVEASAARS